MNNKILKKIMVTELIVISFLTIFNIIYTFPVLKFTVINKIVILAFILTLFIILVSYMLSKSTRFIQFALIIVNFGLFLVNKILFTMGASINQASKYTAQLIVKKDSPVKGFDDLTQNNEIEIQSIARSKSSALALDKLKNNQNTNNIKQYPSFEESYEAFNANDNGVLVVDSLSDPQLLKVDPLAANNFRIIETFTADNADEFSNKDIANEPFTILVAGIDSRSKDISEIANGDSNILVTFDPKTGEITTLTTPRDSRIPIVCRNNSLDKLTHAAAYGGTSCTKKTLEQLYNIKIDYTFRINFTGVIDIVNALDGIEVEIPKNAINAGSKRFCEQNSHGKKGTICFVEGKKMKLNGEQALAFARNRYNQDGGDFYRGRNQQIVIEAILNKAKKINDINTVSTLLSSASKNIETSLQINDIIALYDIMIGLRNKVHIEKLYIGGGVLDLNGVSYVVPSEQDIAYATYRMKVNLGEYLPQFPNNAYTVGYKKPSNNNQQNPLQKERASYFPELIRKVKDLPN
jgi:polyisoprenyl-teichoic acid--peptidoglycan teichoic acid transferase